MAKQIVYEDVSDKDNEVLANLKQKLANGQTFGSLSDGERNLVRQLVIAGLDTRQYMTYHTAADEFHISTGIISRWMDQAKKGRINAKHRGRPRGSLDIAPRHFVAVDYVNRKNPEPKKKSKKVVAPVTKIVAVAKSRPAKVVAKKKASTKKTVSKKIA